MTPQFTESVALALESAYKRAQEQKQTEITESHLLHSLLEEPSGYFSTLLSSLNLDKDSLLQKAKQTEAKTATFTGEPSPPPLSSSLKQRIFEAEALSKQWKDSYMSADHFLYVFWKSSGEPFSSWKKQSGLSLAQIEAHIKKLRGGSTMDSASAESSLQALDKYCKNLTQLAKEGKLDPVIGEMKRSEGRCRYLVEEPKITPFSSESRALEKRRSQKALPSAFVKERSPTH